jgi:hypothetical protein
VLVPLGQRIRRVSCDVPTLTNEEKRKDVWMLITQIAADSGGRAAVRRVIINVLPRIIKA